MGFFNKDKKDEVKVDAPIVQPIVEPKVEVKPETKLDDVSTPKTKEEKKQAKNEGSMPITVIIYDVWGTTRKFQTRFGVEKLVEGSNLYLFNKLREFKEPIPEDSDEYKKFKLDELKKLIEKKEKELEKSRQEKREADSLDFEQDLRIYKGWKRSLELQGRGSYMSFDYDREGGKPVFEFVRKGVFKLPVFFNVEIDTLYIPSEAKLKTAAQLLKENDEKNGKPDMFKIATIVLLVILSVLVLAAFYFMYKTQQFPAEISANLGNTTQLLAQIADRLSFHTDFLINATNSTEPINNIGNPNLIIVK